MKIVEFKNGRFALRKWSITRMRWTYFRRGFIKPHWVCEGDWGFVDCLFTTPELVREAYGRNVEQYADHLARKKEFKRGGKVVEKL